MKMSAALLALSVLSLTACAPAGYYDSNGEYRSYGKSDSYRDNTVRNNGAPETTYDAENNRTDYVAPSNTTIIYDRRGYYDSYGNYITADNSPSVPASMFPPRGMCRVWFEDRATRYQPPVESCTGIQSRVPAGAYVIYGG